jgi:hypothetical protein
MNTKIFTNADSLVEYCTENNILAGQVWVEHNPLEKGDRTLLWFYISSNKIGTNIYNQHDIEGYNYSYVHTWHNIYKGSFELVLPYNQFTKPEVYAVGDWVEVLENAKEIGNWKNLSPEQRSSMIGKCYKIDGVSDHCSGIYYTLNDRYSFIYPHYCVKKLEEQVKEMTQAQIEQELGYKVKIID